MAAFLALLLPLALQAATMELGKGPVATTTVAVKVQLDAEGRVIRCLAAQSGSAACAGFPKGRVVSVPLRRDGKPVAGTMTVSTTTVVSAD